MKANPTKQWFTREIHKPYCRWKQARYYRLFDALKTGTKCRIKMMTAIPRGWLKTTINIGSKMWSHLEDVNMATYLGSSDDALAQEIFSSVEPIYAGTDEYAQFHRFYGMWFDPTRKSTKGEMVHAVRRNTARKEPSFKTFSITTGFKGHHPDISDLDDPVDREKMQKEDGSAHLAQANQAIINHRPAMSETSIYEITMTRYHDDDPQGKYQRQEGVKSWDGHPSWDPEVVISDKGEWEVYHIQARDPDSLESACPAINTTDDLDRYEASNTIEFWNQMMNQPARGDHMGLDISQIPDLWVNPEHVPPGDYIINIDTAFKDPKKMAVEGCESTWTISLRDRRPTHADYYVIESYGSKKDRIEDFTEKLVVKLQEYQRARKRVYMITDERSPGKTGAWFHYLANMCNAKGVICPPTHELVRGGGGKRSKKISRIRVAAGFWADGRIKLVRGGAGVHKLASQMTRFEVIKIIDRADATADLFHPDIYVVQTPVGENSGSGVRQVGPFDDDGSDIMSPPHQTGGVTEGVIDTIHYESDPWR